MWVYFWAFQSIPSVYVSVPCCFDYCSFVVQSEIWAGDKLQLCCFFLKTALSTQDLWWFHIHFRFICSTSMKKVMGKMSCINMQIALGSMAILTIFFQWKNVRQFSIFCIIFSFLHQYFILLRAQVLQLLGYVYSQIFYSF